MFLDLRDLSVRPGNLKPERMGRLQSNAIEKPYFSSRLQSNVVGKPYFILVEQRKQ